MEQPAQTLTYDRIELRRWHAGDADALDRAVTESLEHLRPWMPWAATHSREQVAEYLARCDRSWDSGEAYNYAITYGGELIGSCSLMRRIGPGGLEIGYWMHPAWTGQGLATMSVHALIHQGFALRDTTHLEIHHDAANARSEAVPRRLGFTQTERVREPDGPTAPGEKGVQVVWRMDRALTEQ